MKHPLRYLGWVMILCAACSAGTNENSIVAPSTQSPFDRSLQGGETTVDDRTDTAFNDAAANLNRDELAVHEDGNDRFEAVFVPTGTPNPGLGPIFNHVSCQSCHIGNGRGDLIVGSSTPGSQALVRVSIPGGTPELPGGPGAVPGIGTQIEDHAIAGYQPEADIQITWTFTDGTYADGTPFELRSPELTLTPTGAAFPSDLMTSLRLAPPVFGLGLLEAIPPEVLENLADPEDKNGDGIRGKVNHVWNLETASVDVGRFGRKSNIPTLRMVAGLAHLGDIGVSNPLALGTDITPDIDDSVLDATAFYTQTLGVPRAVNIEDPQVRRGEKLFAQANCTACHIPMLETGPSSVSPALAFQRIFPYTDLLVHDMGPGLADGRPDFEAGGGDWRTSPLWGLGVSDIVMGKKALYLHDGRARTLEEAILWHGGESKASREFFRNLPKPERDALLAFLRSL